MIAAMGKNRVIGRDNELPWHLPDDFRYFKETTKGHFVLMGRKNWESLPKKFQPLPDRPNLVITHQAAYRANGAEVFASLDDALEFAKDKREREAFIIGGGEIYRLGLKHAQRIYLTEINGLFEGQVSFPKIDLHEWNEISRRPHKIDDLHPYSFDFVIYEKREVSNTHTADKWEQ